MGIQGLLPLLKSIGKPVHLKDCAGQTLAVDGYVWLHKGAFACAQELCLGQATQKYVTYFMRKIDMFKFYGIKPYVVFDGGYLPSKAATEQDRFCRREESKKLAMELHQTGKSKQALEQFRKCIDVTPEMAFAVIQALETAQVDFVVAPYEADAQLAYLEKIGLVDGIVTEDSDLLVFGCKKVIFKLDSYGTGVEILQKNFSLVQDVSFHEWTMTEIRHMCILAGCDYLPSIPGMGLKTAQRLLRRFKSFERTIKHIRMEHTSSKIQADYEDAFRKADLTFLYARVYDPISKSMVHLNSVPEELEDLVQTEEYDFLGPVLEEHVLHAIVTGKVNPISKTPLSHPMTHQLVQRITPGHVGKENKPRANKNHHPIQPSSKSLYAYFNKTSTPSSRSAPDQAGECVQKREPLREAGTQFKRRAMERPPSVEVPLHEKSVIQDDPSLVSQKLSSTSTKKRGTVVAVVKETQSRFFELEAPTSSEAEAMERSASRSCTAREDSGVGLDEASLLHMILKPIFPWLLPRSSRPHAAGTSSSTEDTLTLEFKKAEAKVIQGWREKFSNPSGTGNGRTPGLTRAFFQANVCVAKSRPPAPQTTSRSKQHPVRSAKAAPAMSGQSGRQSGMRIVRTTPGRPVYHLDAVRCPAGTTDRAMPGTGTSKSSTAGLGSMSAMSSSPPGSSAMQDGYDDALGARDGSCAMLNLDRFKYTPAAPATASASTSSFSVTRAVSSEPELGP
ncbi:Rad2 nuclease [Modicella reniformis]|uniref:Rad2 nuclease n=1 Tax=Modicella reniformis TaxID=1440133 RepID=A0A9P6MFS7_9FUNG|nr:Rad2 nuclease [Modicella reniformis]